jgi:hypothetical protein|eukprot:COSAG01_NODE_1821_length_9119_cov_4.375345_2_plen_64_part_00
MPGRTRSGYDAHGNPGGPYTMARPPPGKLFGSFASGGRSINWVDDRKLVRLERGTCGCLARAR